MSSLPSALAVDFSSLEDSLTKEQLLQCYRRRNIRVFIGESRQTQLSVSKKLGYSNSTFLAQMVGAHPIRKISEKTARKIEDAFDLSFLSLDAPQNITMDDLYSPDRKRIDPDYSIAKEYLLSKRKYLHSNLIRAVPSPHYSSSAEPKETRPLELDQLEKIIVGSLDLIESSGISTKKAFVILKMLLKELKTKHPLNFNFIKDLIDLSK